MTTSRKDVSDLNSCYKVRACCSTRDCDYVQHKDIIRTINHESSFSFAMWMNGLDDLQATTTCPRCGSRLFYYPVTYMAETGYGE
ncbi:MULTISPECIES: hypothetical protein [Paenibacillus]|uniref:hypothetical protein n=1 Tax=Paenibacillus TaxID=44249 RepID=UPI001E59CCE1|nr:hypothetical protein [Paenibacillus validus]